MSVELKISGAENLDKIMAYEYMKRELMLEQTHRKVMIATTGRSDYGYLYWLMNDLNKNNKFNLSILCPSDHPEYEHISTKYRHYLLPDGMSIDRYGKIYYYAKSALEEEKPDILILLGDRFETLAIATATTFLNIEIGHIFGGDVTEGSFDNEIRTAITAMAKYHFTATQDATDNIEMIKIGQNKNLYNGNIENEINKSCIRVKKMLGSSNMFADYSLAQWGRKFISKTQSNNIYCVGSTGLDWINRVTLISEDCIRNKYELTGDYLLVCYNPETKSPETQVKHTLELIVALNKRNEQKIIIMPNIDPGRGDIIKVYDMCAGIKIENVEHLEFLSLMKYAKLMIGNSSAAILEAPMFNLPAVNIGDRQKGRQQDDNITDCDYDSINSAIDTALNRNIYCKNIYGDGESTRRIIEILEAIL